jgi:hypothetical protein
MYIRAPGDADLIRSEALRRQQRRETLHFERAENRKRWCLSFHSAATVAGWYTAAFSKFVCVYFQDSRSCTYCKVGNHGIPLATVNSSGNPRTNAIYIEFAWKPEEFQHWRSMLKFAAIHCWHLQNLGLFLFSNRACTDETASPKIAMTRNDAISFVNHEVCSLPTYYGTLILSLSPEE